VTAGAVDLGRRRAGVCLHLTSLPGPRGIGELGAAARRFMDWLQAVGLSVWQFLPTGPTGFGNSPYQPLSVFAGNPLLIDIDEIVEWELLRPGEAGRALDPAPAAEVDFERVASQKGPLLALAVDRFLAGPDSGLALEFDAFCAVNAATWLDDFAAYVVLRAQNRGAPWSHWPETGHGRSDLVARTRRAHEHEFERARLVQFFFERQWQALRAEARRRGIVLFGDVPIYMALDCAEAWAHPELLYLDETFAPIEVAGVPPDYFSADGQLWGNPVYRWDTHAADGFGWWIARLGRALAGADLVRLDHFRGFDEFWSVPRDAATARGGRWSPGPRGALFDAVTAIFGNTAFVAEDLGMITESVVALRQAYALPGMQVLQFLVDQPDFDAGAITEDCICYTGTHDNDTTRGWFDGSGGRLTGEELGRFRATVLDNVEGAEESIDKAMIFLCFNTNARIAIAPLQDYLGLDGRARLNTPGEPEGNWRWRADEAGLDRADLGFIADSAAASGRS